MKIAFVTIMAGNPWGGSEYLWAEAAHHAIRQGHEVMISVFDWSARHPVIRQLAVAGARLHIRRRWPMHAFAEKILNRAAFELYRRKWWPAPYAAIKRFNPDFICVSQGGSTDLVYDGVQRLVLESGKPFFIISQMNFEHRILPFHIIAPLQEIFRKAALLFFVSDRNREVLERQVCLKLPHSMVVANPANLHQKERLPFPTWEGDALQMACVGRLECDAKGQDILLQVLSSDAWKQRKWALNLYGQGRDEKYLRLLSRAFGIEDRVFFQGHVDDVADIWRRNQLLLMPSLREGTPLALIEAMACGRPAVVTDVAGNDVYCMEGQTGFLAEAPNVKYFGSALERAWAARGRWEAMGEAACAFYNQNTDKEPSLTLLRKMIETVRKA